MEFGEEVGENDPAQEGYAKFFEWMTWRYLMTQLCVLQGGEK